MNHAHISLTGLYRVLLTEGRYTTAEGPVDRAAAMTEFREGAPYCDPTSGSFFRVVTEDEYQRIWPEINRRNEAVWRLVDEARTRLTVSAGGAR